MTSEEKWTLLMVKIRLKSAEWVDLLMDWRDSRDGQTYWRLWIDEADRSPAVSLLYGKTVQGWHAWCDEP